MIKQSAIFFSFLLSSITLPAAANPGWFGTIGVGLNSPGDIDASTNYFGTKYLGLLYGIVFLSHQIGSFFGAYLGGLFHDLYGSYDYAWYLAIALSVFAAIIHLPIKEEPVLRLKTE